MPQPERGSSLFADDIATAPYHCSHFARQLIGVATDHLHCLRAAVEAAGALHTWAPFTLLRAATETAACASYVLGPPKRAERVLHRLQMIDEDDQMRSDYFHSAGHERPDRAAQLAELRQVGQRTPGLDVSRIGPRPPGYAKIVHAGGDCTVMGGEAAEIAWRMCSGLAHGRQWASLSLLELETLDTISEGITSVRMTASVSRLSVMTNAALALTSEAVRIFVQRSRRP